MDNMDKINVIDTVIKYLYNADKVNIFKSVYGEGHEVCYMQEKIELINNMSRFWGQLDNEHKAKLVKSAGEYYEYRK